MSTHIIKCQTWVLCLSSQQPSWAIKNTVSQWARVPLPPILATICDEQTQADKWCSLDTVELDLGVIELPTRPQQVIAQIATAFSQALAEQLQHNRPEAIIERDEDEQTLRTLDYFIKTGTRPWWAPKEAVARTQCLLRLINRIPTQLRESVCHYLSQARCLQRLIEQFPDNQLLALSRLLAQNAPLEQWCQQINVPLRRAFTREQFAAMALRSAYWQAIFITSETMSRVTMDKTAFYKHVLLHLATHCQLNYRYLLMRLAATLRPQEKIADPWPTLLSGQHDRTREKNTLIYAQLLIQLQQLREGYQNRHTTARNTAERKRAIKEITDLIAMITLSEKDFSEKNHQSVCQALHDFNASLCRSASPLSPRASDPFAHLPYPPLVMLRQTLQKLYGCPLIHRHHALIHRLVQPLALNEARQARKIENVIPLLSSLLHGLQQEIGQIDTPSPPDPVIDPPSRAKSGHSLARLRKDYKRLQQQYQALLTCLAPASAARTIRPDLASETLEKSLMTTINTLSVVLKKQQQAHQEALIRTRRPPPLLAREADTDQQEDIYVDNAGLTLLGIHLKPFFTTAHLLQGDHFIDNLAARRAALLLQYLMTSQSTCVESALTFNKLLCGLDLLFWPNKFGH